MDYYQLSNLDLRFNWKITIIIDYTFTQGSAIGHSHRGVASCNDFLSRLNASEQAEKMCEEYRHNILGNLIKTTSPFLYPFIIEFALIGASVAYLMSNHIGKRCVKVDLVIWCLNTWIFWPFTGCCYIEKTSRNKGKIDQIRLKSVKNYRLVFRELFWNIGCRLFKSIFVLGQNILWLWQTKSGSQILWVSSGRTISVTA